VGLFDARAHLRMASESRELFQAREFQTRQLSREVSPFSEALQKGKMPKLWSTSIGTSVSVRARARGHAEDLHDHCKTGERECVLFIGTQFSKDSQQGLALATLLCFDTLLPDRSCASQAKAPLSHRPETPSPTTSLQDIRSGLHRANFPSKTPTRTRRL
jgi:hypothetical protein